MFKSRLVATGADNTALACALPPQTVFYFDRVPSGTLELASRSRKQDAFVVIAPSGIQGKEMFLDFLLASHILKYSYERLTELGDEVALAKVPWRSEPWGRLACISAYTGLGAWDRATVKDLERGAALRQPLEARGPNPALMAGRYRTFRSALPPAKLAAVPLCRGMAPFATPPEMRETQQPVWAQSQVGHNPTASPTAISPTHPGLSQAWDRPVPNWSRSIPQPHVPSKLSSLSCGSKTPLHQQAQ